MVVKSTKWIDKHEYATCNACDWNSNAVADGTAAAKRHVQKTGHPVRVERRQVKWVQDYPQI
jgi:hypothetical protein